MPDDDSTVHHCEVMRLVALVEHFHRQRKGIIAVFLHREPSRPGRGWW
ncbi:MAG: hypothetical protein LC792_07830 [Actinobacteria bacterium]|nr:hypothetical protein [Actinomycetota bacterium]